MAACYYQYVPRELSPKRLNSNEQVLLVERLHVPSIKNAVT